MKVALVHDDLVQWGGAERVLAGLCEIYPDAPIFTSVLDYSNTKLKEKFAGKEIITTFLQDIPGWSKMYKQLLPVYPLAFEQFNFDNFDLVISNTTRFAKAVITKPQTAHICYCHTPPRFLWHFSGIGNMGISELLMTRLRLYDQVIANRVDFFIAGSENAKRRIEKIYRQKSKVIYPFVEMNRFDKVETFNGCYFVILGRANKYKRFDIAVEACKKTGRELKIIDGSFSDHQVVEILAGCSALITAGEEDFGISSLEAQALGKPVLAYGKGGALETIIDGKTGILFGVQSAEALILAMKKLETTKINPELCKENAIKFSKEAFSSGFKKLVASLLYTN